MFVKRWRKGYSFDYAYELSWHIHELAGVDIESVQSQTLRPNASFIRHHFDDMCGYNHD